MVSGVMSLICSRLFFKKVKEIECLTKNFTVGYTLHSYTLIHLNLSSEVWN